MKIRNEGGRKRAELIAKAKEMRAELEIGVKDLQVVIQGLEQKHKSLLEDVKVVEARERAKMVRAEKANVGKVNVVKEVVDQRISELRVKLETLRDEERSLRGRLTEAEMILEGLKQTYNPNFNDEGVKNTIRKWEDYVAAGKSVGNGAKSNAEERDLEELINGEGLDWDELLPVEEEVETPQIYKVEEYLPESVREWIRQKYQEGRKFLVENGLLAEYIPPTVHESKGTLTRFQTMHYVFREILTLYLPRYSYPRR